MLDYLSVLIFKPVAIKGLYIYDTIYFIVAKLIKQVLKTIYNYTNYLPENNKRKVMALSIYAGAHQWNDKLEMFVTDKRIPKLHPDRIYLNEWLTQKKSEILRIIADFDANKVDWTLNQFEQ